MAALQIIGVPQSNFVRVVRMAAHEKGVPYEFISAPPHSPEVKEIHPAGKIPVMRHGDVTLFESRAIAHYIDEHFEGPPLTLGDRHAERSAGAGPGGPQRGPHGPPARGHHQRRS